ncbi:MAG: hypothetical protein Q4E77_01170 [Conchiformibius sp.]|nr:hypothetical protein [Conchiformibius sp.]
MSYARYRRQSILTIGGKRFARLPHTQKARRILSVPFAAYPTVPVFQAA